MSPEDEVGPRTTQEWREFLTEHMSWLTKPSYAFGDVGEIGTALREIRRRGGMTQQAVALAICGSLSLSTNICAYEKGRRTPDIETIMRLLTLYGYRLVIEPIPEEAAAE